MPKLLLASTSPRRRELLDKVGFTFTTRSPDYEEVMNHRLPPEELVIELALGKAFAVERAEDEVVVGADTFIAIDSDIIGKPKSADEAVATLKRLQGRTHRVVTGWAVVGEDRHLSGCVPSVITMASMTDDEIAAYVATGEPLDKAGSYAIHGIGAMFIEHIDGSFDATVGLPLVPVVAALKQFEIYPS